MAKSASKSLKVFIGCPGDMAPERAEVLKLHDHLERLGLHVSFLIWKHATPGAGDAQKVIFENYPIDTWDIFIGLLWTRFGMPCGFIDSLSGENLTGTEAEFTGAYDAWKASGGARPQILLYRCKRDLAPDVDVDQLLGVRKFFKQIETGGTRPALAQDFKTPAELCRMIVQDIKTAAERLRTLAKKPCAAVSSKKKSSPVRTPVPDSGTLLHRYFAGLRDQFGIYENLGLPVPERDGKEGEKDVPIPIRSLFVAPACTDAIEYRDGLKPEAFDSMLLEGKNPAKPLLPRLAPAKSRIVLLADPGMGKSTLIQWLISTLADEDVPHDEEELRGAIPLPFILRDLLPYLPQEVEGWTWDAVVDAFRRWRHRGRGAPLVAPLLADEALFRSILASPDAFFLIDGLDEIGDPQRRTAIREAIWEGFDKYPEARWLITSRIVGYEQAEVDSQKISVSEPGMVGGSDLSEGWELV